MSVLSTFHFTIKPRSNNKATHTHTYFLTAHALSCVALSLTHKIIFMKKIFEASVEDDDETLWGKCSASEKERKKRKVSLMTKCANNCHL